MHRIVWVGRDHLVSTSLLTQAHLPLDLILSNSREESGVISLTVKNFFLISSLNLPSTQFKAISPCLVTTCPYKKSLPSFPVGSFQVLEGCYKVSSEPSLLQVEEPQLSQPILIEELLQPSNLWPSSKPAPTTPRPSCTGGSILSN